MTTLMTLETANKIKGLGLNPDKIYRNAYKRYQTLGLKLSECRTQYVPTKEFADLFLACALTANDYGYFSTISVHQYNNGVTLFLSTNDRKNLRNGNKISYYDEKVRITVKDHITGEETESTEIGRYLLSKALELGIKVYYADNWKVYKERN